MKLYNPPNIILPALKLNKTRERKMIENDHTVNNIIGSNLLLDIEFNKLYLDILKKSKQLLLIIRLPENKLFRKFGSFSFKKLGIQELEIIKRIRSLKHSGKISKDLRKEFDEVILKMKKETYKDVRKKVVKLSNSIQNSISIFEERRKVDLSILSSTTIYVCKNCANIISLNKFKRCTCLCGEKIIKTSKVKQIPIYHFNDKLINLLDRNYWFEYGVDYILRRKNLQTLVGFHILGHSGVWHEIDNIAESKSENFRFFCECKNAEVTVNDIFVFSGKMIDIGCTRGYVFTTSEKVSSEIVRLARSKNIDIVKGALVKGTTSLLEDIKEG